MKTGFVVPPRKSAPSSRARSTSAIRSGRAYRRPLPPGGSTPYLEAGDLYGILFNVGWDEATIAVREIHDVMGEDAAPEAGTGNNWRNYRGYRDPRY